MRRTIWLILVLCLTWDLALSSSTPDDSAQEKEGLTLERLFPEKSVFGPTARSMAFSSDGRYGAWLWRPRVERRHGSDLWIRDFKTGETSRVTSATVLAPFQKQAREVVADREKKAAKRAKAKEDKKDEKDKKEEKKLIINNP